MKPGVIVSNCAQGSLEWFNLRRGVVTASNVHKALAKKGSESRSGFISELIAQIATDELPEQINARAMEWGKAQEPVARSTYEFARGVEVQEVGFILSECKRLGASPDGLIIKENRGLEIKCPFTSKVHVDFLLMDKIKLEYIYQVQFSMWVSGLDTWDFASFDPRFKKNLLKFHTIERDESLFERFKNEIGEFLIDMDAAVNKLALGF
jgi:putative phage-type endonuclease